MTLPAILIGAGGHARVVASMARALNISIIGVCDPALADQGQTNWNGLAVLGADSALGGYNPAQHVLLNGIGMLPSVTTRRDVHQKFQGIGWQFVTLVHPTAWVAPDVVLGVDIQVMAGAIIQPGSVLADGVIVNTRVSVDHDCSIGKHSHIAPGATLCGAITAGQGVFVGAGATVLSSINLGSGAIISAGSTITRNVAAGTTCFGRFGQEPQV